MRKLGGVIGAVLGFLLVFIIGDHIPGASGVSDWIGTALAVAVAVGGWFVGTRVVQRLSGHGHSRTLHQP